MINYLHTDFESRGVVELSGNEGVGLHNYWNHKDTSALILAYGYDEWPEHKLWRIYSHPMPDDLRKGLEDPKQPVAAFNSAFERYGFKYKLGIDISAERFFDPQASARYLSLPASLEQVGNVLALPSHLQKDKRGDSLIELFCYPKKAKKKRGEPDVYFWNDWNSHPEEWAEFERYCIQDTIAEKELMRRMNLLGAFPLPAFEQEIWIFDQKVNDRGLPVDRQFVSNAYALADRSKKEILESQNKLTGLNNANSPIQMLAWCRERGYSANTLKKPTVESQLKYNPELTEDCKKALEARKAASSTTYKKLSAILRCASPDNMLRCQFVYMGSSRCGRWSGAAVQPHNLARGGMLKNELTGEEFNFEDEDVINEARAMIYRMDYEGIKLKYGSVLLVVKNLIRTAFAVTE